MTTANTNTLVTDFNVDPYYDDFNETKNFHRILFRPGLAVQARELTQMQTVLQNQVDRFAEHIFVEGAVVKGIEQNYDRNLPYIKLRDSDLNANNVDVTAFIGAAITGSVAGTTAYVIDALSGSEANSPNTKTLYVRYTGSGNTGVAKTFVSGESLTSNNGLYANVCTEGVQSANVVGVGSRISFGDGILYAKDHFIRVDSSNTIVGRYSSNVSYKIGFDINETIVSSTTDTTLQDPARGAYNFAAPGADRLKLTATIAKRDVVSSDAVNFIEKVRIKNGAVERNADKPVYAVIYDYIARRRYEESGDYIVMMTTLRVVHMMSLVIILLTV
jgi:hypothetical protein